VHFLRRQLDDIADEVSKTLKILCKSDALREQVKLVFRAESYNVFNHPNLASPPAGSLSIASSTFGVSQAQVGQNDGTTGARQIQGALKVIF
jgi:hypothetical protein